jgi:hypothetical protein
MLSAIGRAMTIGALCCSLGLHWLALQSVAWTTMLVSNARHVHLTEAVAKTFDGAHPCDLCKVVAEGKKSEKKSQILPAIAKMDLICTTRSFRFLPPWVSYGYHSAEVFRPQHYYSPPAPPPRVSFLVS